MQFTAPRDRPGEHARPDLVKPTSPLNLLKCRLSMTTRLLRKSAYGFLVKFYDDSETSVGDRELRILNRCADHFHRLQVLYLLPDDASQLSFLSKLRHLSHLKSFDVLLREFLVPAFLEYSPLEFSTTIETVLIKLDDEDDDHGLEGPGFEWTDDRVLASSAMLSSLLADHTGLRCLEWNLPVTSKYHASSSLLLLLSTQTHGPPACFILFRR